MRRSRRWLLLAFALGGCIPPLVAVEDDGDGSSSDDSSTGDSTITTTTAGPTTSPPPPTTITTVTTIDPDTGTSADTDDCECPPGQICLAGVCFDCPEPICDHACAPNESCACPPGDECCDLGTCTPTDCPADPLPGNYDACLDAMSTPNDAFCDGAPCVTDDDSNPSVSVCMASECDLACQCPPHPGTGNAQVVCEDVTGEGVGNCWLDCQSGETCPDGMECFGGFICIWDPASAHSAYGDCINSPGTCQPGENACLTDGGGAPTGGACSLAGCASTTDCPAPPATGNAPATCADLGNGNTCHLDCSMGQTCPDGMVCTGVGMGMACLWPFVPPNFTCIDGDLGSALGPAVAIGTTTGGGNDHFPSCTGGGNDEDVQLRWTAPADGTYTFDTIGSDYDTVLMIHPDCVGPELVCNDDTVMLLSEVTLGIAGGQSVLIVIDGWNQSGNYVLNIQ